MELNNIPNDKDTTVVNPMQEQIRNVPKTDVEPTTDFQVGELPEGGFTKVDAEEGTDARRMQEGLRAYEIDKVTKKDAKKDAFPSGKKITYEDIDDIVKHHTDEGANQNLTNPQRIEHGMTADAWKQKKVDMDKKVLKLANSISKSKDLHKGFTTEDWENIVDYYRRNPDLKGPGLTYSVVAKSMLDNEEGLNSARQLAKITKDADRDDKVINDRWQRLKDADDILKSKAATSLNLAWEFDKALDAADKEKLEKIKEDERKREDERIGKLTGPQYAQELKKAGLTEEAARQKMEEFNARHPNEPSVKFKVDEALNAVFPKAKPAAKVEKAKPTPKAAVETPVTSEVEEVKPKNAAEEKLEEKVNVSLGIADAFKDFGEDVVASAEEATKKMGEKAKKLNDGRDLMNNLPDFAINRLLRNEFGDLMVDKNGKKVLNSKALGTYGWFVLDNLGAALVNASLVARGMTPTQKSAYKQYLENEMLNAIGRKNKLTESINDIQLQGLVSDKELLTTIGTERIKLGSTEIDNALRAYQNDIDTARFAKLLNENAQYLSTLSDESKQEMLKFLALQAQDADINTRILGRMWTAEYKRQLAKTDAEREIAGIQVQQGNLELQMKEKDIAKAAQALDIMQADLKQKYKNLEMTDLDMEKLKLAIEKATKDNKYYEVEKVMGIIKEGSSTAIDVIKGFIEAFIPGI